MATNYSPKIITDGLVYYFDFANPKGVDINNGYLYNLANKNFFIDFNPGSITTDPTKFEISGKKSLINITSTYSPAAILSGDSTLIFWGNFDVNSSGTLLNGADVNGGFTATWEANTKYNFIYADRETACKVKQDTIINDGPPIDTNYHMILIENLQALETNNVIFGPWIGVVTIIMWYDRRLTEEEILQNYNAIKGRYEKYNKGGKI